MKRLCITLAAAALSAPALAGPDVGVSVDISQPGFYGRVDIGRVSAPPVLVYPQPVIIARPAVVVEQRPVYMHVPPGHAKNWRKHCGRYDACGRPVYFVRDDWYQQHYAVRDDHRHGHSHGHGKSKGRGRDD